MCWSQVSKSIEDFDAKVERLKEERKLKWKLDMAKNSGRSEQHLEKVRTTNKEKTEQKVLTLKAPAPPVTYVPYLITSAVTSFASE